MQETRSSGDEPRLEPLDLSSDASGSNGGGAVLGSLLSAASAWVESGRPGPIARWLVRELDPDGVPRRLPLEGWAEGLRILADAAGRGAEPWPDGFYALI